MSATPDDIGTVNYMNVVIPSIGSKYSHVEKIEACSLYLILGNTKKVSQQLNIPQNTVLDWKKSEWWQELTTNLREQNKDELNSNYDRILHTTLETIENKLENDKDDLKIVDLAKVHGILFDKKQILNNKPTSISGNVSNEQLKALRDQFEQLAGKTIEGERIE